MEVVDGLLLHDIDQQARAVLADVLGPHLVAPVVGRLDEEGAALFRVDEAVAPGSAGEDRGVAVRVEHARQLAEGKGCDLPGIREGIDAPHANGKVRRRDERRAVARDDLGVVDDAARGVADRNRRPPLAEDQRFERQLTELRVGVEDRVGVVAEHRGAPVRAHRDELTRPIDKRFAEVALLLEDDRLRLVGAEDVVVPRAGVLPDEVALIPEVTDHARAVGGEPREPAERRGLPARRGDRFGQLPHRLRSGCVGRRERCEDRRRESCLVHGCVPEVREVPRYHRCQATCSASIHST